MNQGKGSERASANLAEILKAVFKMAQWFIKQPLERPVIMTELGQKMEPDLWSCCYCLAEGLMHRRRCTRLQYQAALELLRLCSEIRAAYVRLEELIEIEIKEEGDDVVLMNYKRQLIEILLRVRVALQMAGKRVRLKDLYLV